MQARRPRAQGGRKLLTLRGNLTNVFMEGGALHQNLTSMHTFGATADSAPKVGSTPNSWWLG
jgi:hypothetical protein